MEDSLRRKLWNRVNWPVWSLATTSPDGKHNMNICTYVVPVSMNPKGFMVALYDDTQTLSNVEKTKCGVLQLLSEDQAKLVKRFGTVSGKEKDKLARLKDELTEVNGQQVLQECLGYAELKFIKLYPGGDHILGYAELVSSKNINLGEPLTTHYLKEHKIIR